MDNNSDNYNNNENKKDIMKNYKGPLPAYKSDNKKVSADKNNETSIIDNQGFYTPSDSINTNNKEHQVSSIINDLLNEINDNHDNGFPQNEATSWPNQKNVKITPTPSVAKTESFTSVIDMENAFKKNNINDNSLEETSIMDQYRKFTKDNFSNVDDEGTLVSDNISDNDFYDDFYDEYDEELGFFEKLKIKRQNRRKAKQDSNDNVKETDQENDPSPILSQQLEDDYEEEEELEELESDYKNPSEAGDKIHWIDHMVSSYAKKVIGLGILTLFAFFISLPQYTGIKPLFKLLDVAANPRAVVLINIAIIIIAIILNISNIKRGLDGFVKFNSNGNSMMSVFSFFSLIYTIVLLIKPDLLNSQLIHFYSLVVCVIIFLNTISHLIETLRIRNNFLVVSSQKQKIAAVIANNEEFNSDMVKILGDIDPQIIVPVKTRFLKRFFELSFDDYYEDSPDKIMTPVSVLIAIVMTISTYFLFKNADIAISTLFSSLAIATPLTSILCTNLPLYRASKKLGGKGAIISGNTALWDFSQSTAITVDAVELFPKNSTILQGIKTFEGGRIDQAILDAASVLNNIKSPLAKTFLDIIENRHELLSKVDSIMYEDEMGVSAWVDDRRILVGNRNLMINHGVKVPDTVYESRYLEGGREIVYLATSGMLTAMYVVKYMAETHIAHALEELSENNITIIVRTTDPNITPLKLSEVFGINIDNIRVIPERKSGSYERVTRPEPRIDANIAFMDNILGYFSSVIYSIKLFPTISTSFLVQTIGIVVGVIIIILSAFFDSIMRLTPFTLIIYNLFWLFIVWIINTTKKL